ncbi:hypothetical protein EKO25_26150 [Bacillus sp. SAJ1]|nr:hypothetical protein EKO25_26150 [Bacillus sp. SAJ1]
MDTYAMLVEIFRLCKAKSPNYTFFETISGISPSIYAFFNNNYELSGIYTKIDGGVTSKKQKKAS